MPVTKEFPTQQKDDFLTILQNEFKLITKSWEALLLNLLTFIQILLVILLPYLLFLVLPFVAAGVSIKTFSGSGLDWAGYAASGAILATLFPILFVLFLACVVWAGVATAITQLASVRGMRITLKEVFEHSRLLLWKFLGLCLLGILAVVLLRQLLPMFVTLIVVAVGLTFASYVLVEKRRDLIDSISETWRLIRVNWKITLAYVVVLTAISLPQFLFGQPGSLVTFVLSVAYFCLPAILYVRFVGAHPGKVSTSSKNNHKRRDTSR